MIPQLNYLTSKQVESIMTSSSERPSCPQAWNLLAHLWRICSTVLDDSAPALEEMGLSPKTFFLLKAVGDHPFPAELARVMHLPPPTVTYMVKQLESLGYIERRPEPGDLRKFRLIVTETGARAMARGQEEAATVLNLRLARLGPEELSTFQRYVERLSRPAGE
jgi:DNA-binding MarR family transcriptional regulator